MFEREWYKFKQSMFDEGELSREEEDRLYDAFEAGWNAPKSSCSTCGRAKKNSSDRCC